MATVINSQNAISPACHTEEGIEGEENMDLPYEKRHAVRDTDSSGKDCQKWKLQKDLASAGMQFGNGKNG